VVITYGSTTTETWIWTGANWIQASSQVAPSALNPMAYDPTEQRAVMPVTININDCRERSAASPAVGWVELESDWPLNRAHRDCTGSDRSKRFLLFGGNNLAPAPSTIPGWVTGVCGPSSFLSPALLRGRSQRWRSMSRATR